MTENLKNQSGEFMKRKGVLTEQQTTPMSYHIYPQPEIHLTLKVFRVPITKAMEIRKSNHFEL